MNGYTRKCGYLLIITQNEKDEFNGSWYHTNTAQPKPCVGLQSQFIYP